MVGGGEGDALHCWSFVKGCQRRDREGEGALLSSSAMREKGEDDAGKTCEEVGSVSKNRKVLRISLHSRLVPLAVSCSLPLLAYLLVFSPVLR